MRGRAPRRVVLVRPNLRCAFGGHACLAPVTLRARDADGQSSVAGGVIVAGVSGKTKPAP